METRYEIYVFKDLQTGMLCPVKVNGESPLADGQRQVVAGFWNDSNFELEYHFPTNNRREFNTKWVEAKVKELLSYCGHYQEWFNIIEFESKEVKNNCLENYLIQERTLMRQVALSVEVCIHEGAEVTDELAWACYDFRKNEHRRTKRKAELMLQALS